MREEIWKIEDFPPFCVPFLAGVSVHGNLWNWGKFRKIWEVSAPESGYFCYMKETTAYPDQYEIFCRLKECPLIHFRPIRPGDSALLLELFHSHSEQTLIHGTLSPCMSCRTRCWRNL